MGSIDWAGIDWAGVSANAGALGAIFGIVIRFIWWRMDQTDKRNAEQAKKASEEIVKIEGKIDKIDKRISGDNKVLWTDLNKHRLNSGIHVKPNEISDLVKRVDQKMNGLG